MFRQIIIILFIPLFLAAQNGSYPDSIYMKSGKGFPCLISELNEKDITIIYQDNYKIKAPLIGVEKLILAHEGIIYQSGFGYLKNPASFTIFFDERIPKERNSKASETSSYPDSIYMKSGKGYHCFITQLNEVYVTIIYRDNNKIKVPLTGVEKLMLAGEGIIFQSGVGYLKHPASLKTILFERVPKDTTGKYHLSLKIGITTDFLVKNKLIHGFGSGINVDYQLKNIPVSIRGTIRYYLFETSRGFDSNVLGVGTSVIYYPITWKIEPYIGLGIFHNSNNFSEESIGPLNNSISAEITGGIMFTANEPTNFIIEITQTFNKPVYNHSYFFNGKEFKNEGTMNLSSLFIKASLLFRI